MTAIWAETEGQLISNPGVDVIETLAGIIRYCLPAFLMFAVALVVLYGASIRLTVVRAAYRDLRSLIIGNALNSGFRGFTSIALLLTTLSIDLVVLFDAEVANLVTSSGSVLGQIQTTQLSSQQLFFLIVFFHFLLLFLVMSMCQTALSTELAAKGEVYDSPYNIIRSPEDRVRPHYDVTPEEFWRILEDTRDRPRRFLGDIVGVAVLSSSIMVFFCRL